MIGLGTLINMLAIIFCVGVNLIWKKTIRVANLLPALVVTVVYGFVA